MGDDADPSIPPAAPSEDTHVAESDESDALHPAIYACPHCGESVEIDPHITEPLIDCPHCREQFALPPTELAENTRDGDDETNHAGESELDGTRIRQLTTLRRAAIRARTYLQIGFVVCGTGGVQLTLKAMLRVRFEHVWDIRTFAFDLGSTATFDLGTPGHQT